MFSRALSDQGIRKGGMPGAEVTQKDLMAIITRIEGNIDRLEDKTDKKLCRVEDKGDDIERRLSTLEGKASVTGGIAGSITRIVGSLVLEAPQKEIL